MKLVMKSLLAIVGALVAIVIIAGVFAEDPRDSKEPPFVAWSKYAPYKKIGIEESIEKKSCEGLQKAFDATDDAKLLGFIDWHLNNIGCYK